MAGHQRSIEIVLGAAAGALFQSEPETADIGSVKWLFLVTTLLYLQVGPNILVSPDSGQAGTEFVVTGNGFQSGERARVLWDGANLGGTVRVGPDGSFEYSSVVPDGAIPGAHTIEAQIVGGGSGSARATFTVSAAIPTTTSTVATTTTSSTTTTSTTSGVETTPTTATPTTSVQSANTTTTTGLPATGETSERGITAANPLTSVPVETPTGEQLNPAATPETEEAATQALQTTRDGSSGTGGLVAALLVIAGAAGIAFLVWRRSHGSDAAPSQVDDPATDEVHSEEAVALAPLLPTDVQGHEGDWARQMMELAPRGDIEKVITTSDGLIALGRTTDGDGGGAACVWTSSDGVRWDHVATLGRGSARLAIPWREGLLAMVSSEHEPQIRTTCWWSEDTATWRQLTDHDDASLEQVSFEGTAADQEIAVSWGRSSDGPGVWFSRDGATWHESALRANVDLIASMGNQWLAFGREPTERRPMVAQSPDGLSWGALSGDMKFVFDGASVATVVAFEGGMIAAGTDIMGGVAAIWVSDDGSRWLRAPLEPGPGTSIEHLAVIGDHIIGVGADTGNRGRGRGSVAVWDSRDAVSWERVPVSELFANAIVNSIAVMDDSLLVCGTLFTNRTSAGHEAVPVVWTWSRRHTRAATEPAAATTA